MFAGIFLAWLVICMCFIHAICDNIYLYLQLKIICYVWISNKLFGAILICSCCYCNENFSICFHCCCSVILYISVCVSLATNSQINNSFIRSFVLSFVSHSFAVCVPLWFYGIDCVTGTYFVLVILRNRSSQLDIYMYVYINTRIQQIQYPPLCGLSYIHIINSHSIWYILHSYTYTLYTHTNTLIAPFAACIVMMCCVSVCMLVYDFFLHPKIALSQEEYIKLKKKRHTLISFLKSMETHKIIIDTNSKSNSNSNTNTSQIRCARRFLHDTGSRFFLLVLVSSLLVCRSRCVTIYAKSEGKSYKSHQPSQREVYTFQNATIECRQSETELIDTEYY